MSYVSNGVLYINDWVSSGEVPGSFYGSAYSSALISAGGTLTNNNVISGGRVTVNSGGTLKETWIYSGATVIASSGSSLGYGGANSINGGTLVVDTPSTNFNIIQNGNIIVNSGGRISDSVTSGGNTITVNSGGYISNLSLTSGDIISVNSGGGLSGGTINTGANVTVSSGGTVRGLTIQSGATLTASSGAQTAGLILNGGTVDAYTTPNFGSVASGFNGTIILESGAVDASYGSNYIGSINYQVKSGATFSSSFVNSGWNVTVSSGGTVRGLTIQSGATLTASSGAQTAGLILNGGTVDAYTTPNFGSVASGFNGTIILESGAVDASYGSNYIGSINYQVKSGATFSSSFVNSGWNVTVSSGGTVRGLTIQSGATLTASSGAQTAGLILNGGLATIWNNTSGTIYLSGDTNAGLTISGLENGGTLSTVISGFTGTSSGDSDGIEIAGISAADVTAVTYPSADSVMLTLKSGKTITMNILGIEKTGYSLNTASDGNLLIEVCFLSGSMIHTPEGDVPVEDIRMGDTVIAYVHGVSQETTVTWAGTARAAVRSHLRDDEAGYPVRILKDAVSDGVPYKDMLITPEHCLFFDGRFIPARMLINGSSIFYDKSITTYDYYHIETEHHAVIKADGMLTESYLDTGNRRAFIQEGNLVSLRNTNQNWENDAAVPLCVERSFVEPVFRTLQARSVKLFGEQDSVTTAQLTHNPDLHLVTENGASVRPVRHEENVYSFMLPPGTTSVRIVSRTARPTDVIGPFVDDRRELGVAIGTISLITANKKQSVLTHLASEKPDGWYPENGERSIAWTNGNAFLPLEEKAFPHQILLLSLTVLAAGPYLFEENTHTNPDMKKQSA